MTTETRYTYQPIEPLQSCKNETLLNTKAFR